MTAAMLMQVWGDTLVTTAILVLAVLALRKPFARHFGPRLAYTLWLAPALRLVLPPLPLGDPAPAASPAAETMAWVADTATPASASAAPSAAALASGPGWSMADATPWLFAVWCVGVVIVLGGAMLGHRRFCRRVLTGAVELEPIGSIRLVMSDGVDGPVAFGLLRRHVAVPRDFFARYVADERALAIAHELAHHRHGDLWANAAALLMLAAQWFNPFAWRAIRAFRFDQEAACDARVLALDGSGADAGPRDMRTACYATAIAKSAVGARLSLVAPMAVHDNLQERLMMLMRQDISKKRGVLGRLLVGSATLAVLATTATLVPAGIATANAQPSDAPAAPPAPPRAPDASSPPVHGDHQVMVFTSENGAPATAEGGKRETRTVIIRRDGEGGDDAPRVVFAPAEGAAPGVRRMQIRMPGGLSRDDVLATLKEQGITGKQADAIADRLEAKRKEKMTMALAPMPPMPPMAPMPPMPNGAGAMGQVKATALANCRDGQKPVQLLNSESGEDGKRGQIVMMSCNSGLDNKEARVAALKKARERFAKDGASAMSADMRAKVLGDLDRAIAEAEKSAK